MTKYVRERQHACKDDTMQKEMKEMKEGKCTREGKCVQEEISGGKYTQEAKVKAQEQSDRLRKGSLELKGKKWYMSGTAQHSGKSQERQNMQEKASIG